MRSFIVLPCTAAALCGSSANAGDQGLQSALMRVNCVPARVTTKELSAKVTAYEVTCKAASWVVTVICVQSDCRVQARAREEEER
jgi:hypothetical protein